MTLTLSAPSKTFLVGEYAVLRKAPALILNTSPRFELVVRRGPHRVEGIAPESPAGRWLRERRPLLDDYQIEFVDCHRGAGGLGASGAQFLTVHCLTTFLQSSFARALAGPDLKDVWNDLQVLSEGLGSGADVLAQAAGQVALVDVGAASARALPWPYPELGWVVVRTHRKIATHEHLRDLDRGALSLLSRPAHECVSAFGHAPAEVFVGHLKNFAARLRDSGLQAQPAQALVNLLENEDWCLMAKGCGALGADTVLCLYPAAERERVNGFLRKQSLTIVAGHADLSHGLEIRWT
jgi:hypothetical protein